MEHLPETQLEFDPHSNSCFYNVGTLKGHLCVYPISLPYINRKTQTCKIKTCRRLIHGILVELILRKRLENLSCRHYNCIYDIPNDNNHAASQARVNLF